MTVGGGASGSPLERFNFLRAATVWSGVIGPPVREALKAKAPRSPGPTGGRFAQSIRFERHVIVGGVEVQFSSSVPYAGYVIEGTGPHRIVAVNARALRFVFYGHAPGALAYAHSVQHPGTKANPFPKEVLELMTPFLEKTLAELMSGD